MSDLHAASPKIVLAIFTLQGGGAERFVLTLAEAFLKLGFDAHVVCFKNQVHYPIPDGVKVHFLNYQAYRWLPKIWRNPIFARVFDRYVRQQIGTVQMVISNLLPVDQVLRYSQLDPICFVIHNTISKEYALYEQSTSQQQRLTQQLHQIYGSRPCVCVSQGVLDDFLKIFSQHPKITAIHNPIDAEAIKQQSLAAVDTPADYLVHVGKFKPAKAHEALIRAYAQSKQMLPLLLVGEGGLKNDIMALVEQLGLSDRVIFVGFQANPYPYIRQARLMLLSSVFEGFGIVIAEALALGVPVISTDCEAGPRELLPEANLVPVGDTAALAAKIDQAIANSDDFRSPFDLKLLPDQVAKQYLEHVLGTGFKT
ncbi:MAG: glycosyltransferase [Moraxellaceae bacterium]